MNYCSFCGKDEGQVKRLVKGPAVYICNECVETSQAIIEDGDVAVEPEPTIDPLARESDGLACSRCGGVEFHAASCPHVVGPFSVCQNCEGAGGFTNGSLRFGCATCGATGKVLAGLATAES